MDDTTLLQPGTCAPDVALLDRDGITVPLARFWGEQPLLVFFMRHFGCAACRQHLFQVRNTYALIQERGGAVVAISANDPDLTTRYAATYNLPFPVLSDPPRQAYQAFGVIEGSHWETVGPHVLLNQTKLALQGIMPSLPASIAESKQLGGTYIIDTEGIVQFAHLARPSYNYPACSVYLEVFEQIRQHAP